MKWFLFCRDQTQNKRPFSKEAHWNVYRLVLVSYINFYFKIPSVIFWDSGT
jgi:hypothetical protein